MEMLGGGDGGDVAPELLGGFIQELEEVIASLEQQLVELESSPDNKDLVSSIFRSFHNVKGSSGVMGFKILPELMHFAESALDLVRSGKATVTAELVSLLLEVLNSMREVRGQIKDTGKEGKKRYFAILAKLEETVNTSTTTDSNQQGVQSEEKKAGSEKKKEGEGEDEEYIKVARSLVDQMMLVVGDFMMVESSFQWIKKRRYHDDWEFAENCQRLGHFSNKLQRIVLRMRLSPIKPVFNSMHRLVRTTASDLKKKVNFEVTGTETLLDRSILDVISDPLIHMLRNAVDHGLEGPEDRAKVGKPPEGQLNLSAFYKSGEVVIQISDDGRGLDPKRLKAKAVKMGLITETQAESMATAEAQKLIFVPGFSGAEVVTTVSGRGVGMDVVKSTVESLSGAIDISSTVGIGTTFSLRLPLSLAISECLEFKVGLQSYAVQQANIEEVFNAQSPTVKDGMQPVTDGSRVLVLRNVPMPILPLSQIFEQAPADGENRHIITVKQGNTRFALEVGDIVGPCNIVTQPLPTAFAADAPFSGVTIRGDGTLMFQVDLSKLSNRLQVRSEDAAARGNKVTGSSQLTSSDIRRLQQKIVVFECYERFCVPVHAIQRIVSFESKDFHEVDGRHFITLDGKTIPLVWVESVLLKKDRIQQNAYSILIYQLEERVFGLPASKLMGIIRMPTIYDNTIRSDAVLGSTVVEGNTFTVLDLHGLTARVFPSDVKPVTSRSERKIKKVLIAEDDAFFRENLISFLKAKDLEVVVAKDGAEAREYLQDQELVKSLGAVVTDIEMPRLDGIGLIRWGKAQTHVKDLPFIVLTSITTKEMLKTAFAAGAFAFLAKMHHMEVMRELTRIESGLDTTENALAKAAHDDKSSINRLVTFRVGNNRFALPMEVLKEVSYVTPTLQVPAYPAWMREVTSFRGKMIPVVDLGVLLGLDQAVGPVRNQQAIVETEGGIYAVRMAGVESVVPTHTLTRGEGFPKTNGHETHIAKFVRSIFNLGGDVLAVIEPRSIAVACESVSKSAENSPVEEKAA